MGRGLSPSHRLAAVKSHHSAANNRRAASARQPERHAQTSFTLDVSITDGLAHAVTLYAADWDGGGRSERFGLYDGATGKLLDSETLSNFAAVGKYLRWDVSGHVQVRVTCLSGPNAVVLGEFYDKGPPPLHGTVVPVSATTGTTGAPSAPQVGNGNAPTFLPPGQMNGVDVVLLDRLFANGRHLSDPDFGILGLTDDLG